MENFMEKVCPFCKTEIKDGEAVKVCPACGIPHHEACWEENKGCTTFGCSEQHYEAQGTNPTEVCVNCGAALGDGQVFCPNCGTPKGGIKKNVCSRCGYELQEGQEFCPNCGQKLDVPVDAALNATIAQFNTGIKKKKKKIKIILPIILVIVLAVAGVGGYFVYSNIQQKKMEEAIAAYKQDARDFCMDVAESGSNMEKIGNAIQSAWSAYISNSRYGTMYNGTYIYSIDSAVAAAQDEQSSAISSVRSNDSKIKSMYKSLLVVPDTEDQELQEIKDAVKELYEAYEDMYDVIINVSGNYLSFKSDFGDTDSELADAIGDLSSLIN